MRALQAKTGQTDELIWLREGTFQAEQHVQRPQNERRDRVGAPGSKPQKEIWAMILSEFFRPREGASSKAGCVE